MKTKRNCTVGQGEFKKQLLILIFHIPDIPLYLVMREKVSDQTFLHDITCFNQSEHSIVSDDLASTNQKACMIQVDRFSCVLCSPYQDTVKIDTWHHGAFSQLKLPNNKNIIISSNTKQRLPQIHLNKWMFSLTLTWNISVTMTTQLRHLKRVTWLVFAAVC